MPRSSWIDADSTPDLDAHVGRLEHFTKAMADGVIDAGEMAKQEQNLLAAMRKAEPLLNDAQHEAVTHLLAEVTAYSVMQVLHDLAKARVRGNR